MTPDPLTEVTAENVRLQEETVPQRPMSTCPYTVEEWELLRIAFELYYGESNLMLTPEESVARVRSHAVDEAGRYQDPAMDEAWSWCSYGYNLRTVQGERIRKLLAEEEAVGN